MITVSILLRSLKHSVNVSVFLFSFGLFSQEIEVFNLPEELSEISGLEQLNDTTLIAINDSGNDALLYLLNFDGSIQRKVKVNSVTNTDWEDLAKDREHIYIADIGNNFNKRKDLKILKVRINDLATKNNVDAQSIAISYAEQTLFPPDKDSLFFDAESIAVSGDSIILVTKNRTVPWNGSAYVYSIPKTPGSYSIQTSKRLDIGNGSWRTDSATGMDIFKGEWYILTYGKMQKYSLDKDDLTWEHTFKFRKFTQKESVLVTEDFIFVADEKHKLLGGGKLYRINP